MTFFSGLEDAAIQYRPGGFVSLAVTRVRFGRGIAEITERRRPFTESSVRDTEATSGSRSTRTAPVIARSANRFGLALR
jgi:hypothetical protein